MTFVSIAQVLHSIADKVEIPSSLLDDAFGLSAVPDTYAINSGLQLQTFGPLCRGSVIRGLELKYQKSMAAKQLDQCLHNAAALGMSPAWLDARETGMPKINFEAAALITPALVDLANHFETSVAAHQNGERAWTQRKTSKWQMLDPRRLSLIGFAEEQIADLLDQAGIPHSLKKARKELPSAETQLPNAPAEVATGASQTRMQGDWILDIADVYEQQLSIALNQAKPPTTRSERSSLQRRIWALMSEVASRPDKLKFIVGVHPKKGIEVIGWKSRYFNKEALRKRVERRFKLAIDVMASEELTGSVDTN